MTSNRDKTNILNKIKIKGGKKDLNRNRVCGLLWDDITEEGKRWDYVSRLNADKCN